ncbi:MAG: PAS domain-containing protein [Anaerolineae bacterium]
MGIALGLRSEWADRRRSEMNVYLVNPAFCKLFGVEASAIIGQPAASILGDVSDFRDCWQTNTVIPAKEENYPKYNLYVRKVIFPIIDQQIVACIMVNLTHEWQSEQELRRLRRETIEKVNEVVDNQMKVAQEIASLLGETTAETKVSLLRLISIVDRGAM